MADQLDALLGLDIESDEQARALAAQLRDERMFNDYFSATSNPDVNAESVRKNKAIQKTAQNVGTRRREMARDVVSDEQWGKTHGLAQETQGLAKTRGREATEKHRLDMKKLGKAEAFKDPTTNAIVNLQQRPDGTYVNSDGEPVNTAGLVPYDKYAARASNFGMDKKDAYGNGYYRSDEGRFFLDDVPWTEDEAIRRGKLKAELDIDQAGKTQSAKEEAKSVGEFMTDAFKGSGANRRIQQQYRSAISLVDQGAGTGSVEERIVTFKDVTKALESLQADIGLERIGPLKLTPVSDVDLANVFKTSIPMGLDSEALKIWLEFKIESFGILAEIQDYTYGMLEANNGKMPTGEQKAEMDDNIQKMMASGQYGLTMPDLVTGEPTQGARSPEAQALYDNLSPEQRAEYDRRKAAK